MRIAEIVNLYCGGRWTDRPKGVGLSMPGSSIVKKTLYVPCIGSAALRCNRPNVSGRTWY